MHCTLWDIKIDWKTIVDINLLIKMIKSDKKLLKNNLDAAVNTRIEGRFRYTLMILNHDVLDIHEIILNHDTVDIN